jgi:hypothetical protein
VDLSWSASVDTGGSGLAGYEVFRDNGATPLGTPSVASYSDTTASIATTHSYKVRAYDGAGSRSGFSNQISVTTPDTIPPSAPGAPVFGGISCCAASASWNPATDNVAVTSYDYRLNGGAWGSVGNSLGVNLVGLSSNTTYTFDVWPFPVFVDTHLR